jgi:hypothetical protein
MAEMQYAERRITSKYTAFIELSPSPPSPKAVRSHTDSGTAVIAPPSPHQCPINTDKRGRGDGLRLRQLVAVVQHFAFGVQHDQEIGQARVETQARQLRRFLRAGGCCQQAIGALRIAGVAAKRPSGFFECRRYG